jgi:hypothetical protein
MAVKEGIGPRVLLLVGLLDTLNLLEEDNVVLKENNR